MNRKTLLEAVEFAAKPTGRSSMPELECLKISSDGNVCSVLGTNGDIYCQQWFDCSDEFLVFVPAKKLRATLHAFVGDEVTIEHEDGHVILKSGTARRSLETLDGTHYPALPVVDGEFSDLCAPAIAAAIPALGTVATEVFGSVFMDVEHVVATNRRALHITKTPKRAATCLLPAPSANILAGMEGGQFRCNAQHYEALGESWRIVGKLTTGQIPPWPKALPRVQTSVALPDELFSAVARGLKCLDPNVNPLVQVADSEITVDSYTEHVPELVGSISFNAYGNQLLNVHKFANGPVLMGIGDDESRAYTFTSEGFMAVLSKVSQK